MTHLETLSPVFCSLQIKELVSVQIAYNNEKLFSFLHYWEKEGL